MSDPSAAVRPWLVAFGIASLVHLVLNGLGAQPWESITKCVLAPLLAAWVVEQRGPRLLAVALGLCFLGDLFLELEDMFIVGMAAFAAAHIAFIALGEAGRIDKDATATGLAVMALYILAIFFLTTAIVGREKRTVAAGTGFDPTVRTDCWPRLPATKAAR